MKQTSALKDLVGKDLDSGMLKGDSFKHGKPVGGLEEGFLGSERSMISGTKEQGVQSGLFKGLGGKAKVSVVDGVEGPAEKTDSGQCSGSRTEHSRVTGIYPRTFQTG